MLLIKHGTKHAWCVLPVGQLSAVTHTCEVCTDAAFAVKELITSSPRCFSLLPLIRTALNVAAPSRERANGGIVRRKRREEPVSERARA